MIWKWVDALGCRYGYHRYRLEISHMLTEPSYWVCVHCGRRKRLTRVTRSE